MSDLSLSFEEHLRHLQRTNTPTLVVEGKDDIFLYRKIFEKYQLPIDSIRTVGDCQILKKLYKAFKTKPTSFPNVRLFCADADMAIIVGVHKDYWGIFYTCGYSIENDLLTDSIGYLDNLLADKNYLVNKPKILANLSEWFACEAEKFSDKYTLSTGFQDYDPHFKTKSLLNNKNFDLKNLDFTPNFKSQYLSQPASIFFKSLIFSAPITYIRGHTLSDAFFILSQKRAPIFFQKIENGVEKTETIKPRAFGDFEILDICLAYILTLPNQGNGCIKRLIDKFIEKFS